MGKWASVPSPPPPQSPGAAVGLWAAEALVRARATPRRPLRGPACLSQWEAPGGLSRRTSSFGSDAAVRCPSGPPASRSAGASGGRGVLHGALGGGGGGHSMCPSPTQRQVWAPGLSHAQGRPSPRHRAAGRSSALIRPFWGRGGGSVLHIPRVSVWGGGYCPRSGLCRASPPGCRLL